MLATKHNDMTCKRVNTNILEYISIKRESISRILSVENKNLNKAITNLNIIVDDFLVVNKFVKKVLSIETRMKYVLKTKFNIFKCINFYKESDINWQI